MGTLRDYQSANMFEMQESMGKFAALRRSIENLQGSTDSRFQKIEEQGEQRV